MTTGSEWLLLDTQHDVGVRLFTVGQTKPGSGRFLQVTHVARVRLLIAGHSTCLSVYCGTQNDIRVVISIAGNNTAMFPVGHTTRVRVMMSIVGNNTAMFPVGHTTPVRVMMSVVENNTAMFPVGHTTRVRVMISIVGNNTAMFTFGHKTCVRVKMFTVGHTIRRHGQSAYCWAHNVSELSCLLWVTQMG